MKKNIAVLIAALLSLCLASCGTVDEEKTQSTGSSVTDEAEESTEAASEEEETDAETETEAETEAGAEDETEEETTEEESEPETEEGAPEKGEAPSDNDAKDILTALVTADSLCAGNVQYDNTAEFTSDSGSTYYKYTGSDFSSIAEIKDYFSKYMTDEFYTGNFSLITEGDSPVFIEHDGELYVLYSPKGRKYNFTGTKLDVVDSYADGYSLMTETDDYGELKDIEIVLTPEDGSWKIWQIIE